MAGMRLMSAYMRRKRMEAALMLSVFAGAMSQGAPTQTERISASEMLAMMGVTL